MKASIGFGQALDGKEHRDTVREVSVRDKCFRPKRASTTERGLIRLYSVLDVFMMFLLIHQMRISILANRLTIGYA